MFLTEIADTEGHSSPPYRLESDSLSHVSKHGIKLKSSSNLLRNDSRRVISGSRGSADGTANKPHYIENIVVPLGCSPGSEHSSKHASIYRSASAGHAKSSAGFPLMRNIKSAHGSVRSVACPSSSQFARCMSRQTLGTRVGSQNVRSEGRAWNGSAQAMRFQMEQMGLSRCRTLKRTSELQAHRMEHHYYMAGRQMWLQGRYDVEEDTLQGLRELAQSRKMASLKSGGVSMLYEVNKYFGRNREREMTTPVQRPPTSQSASHSSIRQTPSNMFRPDGTRTAEQEAYGCDGRTSSTSQRVTQNQKPMSGKTKSPTIKTMTPTVISVTPLKQGSQSHPDSGLPRASGNDSRPGEGETLQAWPPDEGNDPQANLDPSKADADKELQEDPINQQPESEELNKDTKSNDASAKQENSGNDDTANDNSSSLTQVAKNMEDTDMVY